MSLKRVNAGRAEQLAPGTKKLIRTDLENILLVNVAGHYHAISNTCPHAGGYLNYGPLIGHIIECPLHFWPFDVCTGKLVGMEGLGLDEQLNVYPVMVEDGDVYIDLQMFQPATET